MSVIALEAIVEAGCEVFVTNDKQLQKVAESETIVLADCDPPPSPK